MKIFITTNGKSGLRQARSGGFTMVELLAVAVIIALFSSVAISFGHGTYKRLQVEKAAKDIYFAAKYARILAVEKQLECKMILSETENSVCLVLEDTEAEENEEGLLVVSDQFSRPTTFDDGIEYQKIAITTFSEPADEDAKVITFKPNGSADTAVIQIGDDKNVYSVYIMASTGKAKMQFGPVEELPMDIIDLDQVEE